MILILPLIMIFLFSSISDDMSMGGETSNRSHENVTAQEANRYRGFNKDTLLATNQIDDSTNLNNRGKRTTITILTLPSVLSRAPWG